MRNSGLGWLAFLVLATVIGVSSCHAWRASDTTSAPVTGQ